MTRRLLVLAALAIAFASFNFSAPPPAANRAPTSIGLIQHRGQFYRFEDLMNPEYRAASDDPFVQSFAEQRHFAVPWAGKGDSRETHADLDLLRTEIWRSEIKSINIHDIAIDQDRLRAHLPWAGDGPRIED